MESSGTKTVEKSKSLLSAGLNFILCASWRVERKMTLLLSGSQTSDLWHHCIKLNFYFILDIIYLVYFLKRIIIFVFTMQLAFGLRTLFITKYCLSCHDWPNFWHYAQVPTSRGLVLRMPTFLDMWCVF